LILLPQPPKCAFTVFKKQFSYYKTVKKKKRRRKKERKERKDPCLCRRKCISSGTVVIQPRPVLATRADLCLPVTSAISEPRQTSDRNMKFSGQFKGKYSAETEEQKQCLLVRGRWY
jgi:hypothetical protein